MFVKNTLEDSEWAVKYFAVGLKSAITGFLPNEYFIEKEKLNVVKTNFIDSIPLKTRFFFESKVCSIEDDMAGIELCYIFLKATTLFQRIPTAKLYFGCPEADMLDLSDVWNSLSYRTCLQQFHAYSTRLEKRLSIEQIKLFREYGRQRNHFKSLAASQFFVIFCHLLMHMEQLTFPCNSSSIFTYNK